MPITPGRRLWALALLILGCAGMAAIWTLVAVSVNRQCGWMALLAALDAVVLVRLARIAGGWRRAGAALLCTLGSIALANWWIAGAQIGGMVGMLPWESIPRIGPRFVWTLAGLANDGIDVACYLAALVLAVLACDIGEGRPRDRG